MTTKARVGIFTLIGLLGIFAAYYFISNFSLKHSGYQIGVHFHDVGGLQEGSSILLSGVQIGEATQVQLLPDQTVDVICTINPGNVIYRNSVFMVAITLTGQTTLNISSPPASERTVAEILPQYPLPEEQQPWGALPPTLAELVTQGQTQLQNLDKTLAVVNKQLPSMLVRFTAVANDSDRLINHADMALTGLGSQLESTVAMLDETVQTSGRNLDELTTNVNGLMIANKSRLSTLVDNLAKTSDNLNKTMAGVASIAQDPTLHASLVGTAANVEEATAKLKAIATDIQSITGDPKTQVELKGAISNLSSAAAKANDLLGRYAGSEAAENTPSNGPSGSPAPQGGPTPNVRTPGSLGHRHGGLFGAPLVQTQIRETWGNKGGGPNSDLNLVVLPGLPTHVTFGANDLGYGTTYNLLLDKSASRNLQFGAGVLYSRLGIAALFRPFGGPVGVDARLYDPKHPTLDLYGDLRLSERLQLFYGERSIWGTAQKTPSFGLQVNY